MNTPLQIIQLLVAPVVMISAAGLICLALYNRLAVIVSRARTFHKERFEAATHLASMSAADRAKPTTLHLQNRLKALAEQGDHILLRGKLVRNALMCLMAEVFFMLTCSLCLGLSLFSVRLADAAFAFFILGTLVKMAGIVMAMIELSQSLEPVTAENFAIEQAEDAAVSVV